MNFNFIPPEICPSYQFIKRSCLLLFGIFFSLISISASAQNGSCSFSADALCQDNGTYTLIIYATGNSGTLEANDPNALSIVSYPSPVNFDEYGSAYILVRYNGGVDYNVEMTGSGNDCGTFLVNGEGPCCNICSDGDPCTIDISDPVSCDCSYTPVDCSNDNICPSIMADGQANWPSNIDPATAYHGMTVEMECNQITYFDESFVTVVDCSETDVIFRELLLDVGDCEEDGYLQKLYCYWYAVDDCGNSSTFGMVVNLVDTQGPVVQNPPDDFCGSEAMTLEELDNYVPAPLQFADSCGSHIVYGPYVNSNDNCDNYEVYYKWLAIDDCGNSSSYIQTICIVDACPEENEPYCTLTQQFYGNSNNVHNGESSLSLLNQLLATPVVLGLPGRSLTLSQSSCIFGMLPASGMSTQLPFGDKIKGSICNPLNNNLVSQALTMELNIRLYPALANLVLSETCLTFNSNVLNTLGMGATVADLMDFANQGLGGQLESGLGTIAAALASINHSFYGCEIPCQTNREIFFGEESDCSSKIICQPRAIPTVAKDFVKIEFESNINSDAQFLVYNSKGELVDLVNFEASQYYNNQTLNISNLPASMYLIQIQIKGAVETVKFIKN